MKKIIWYFLILSISIYAQTIDEAKKLFDDTQKHKEAIEIFKKYPNDGEALYYLGKAYLYGMGVEKDTKKAFEYAKKSSEKNDSFGLNLLGLIYGNGEGVDKDELQALMYYKRAANLGNAKAMRNIAQMYAGVESSFIQKNYDKSVKWLKKAVETGDQESLKVLANVLNSNEINKYEESLKYYNLYLDTKPKDIDFIYLRMGDAYEKINDYSKTYEYYKKSAELDNKDAIIAIIYFDKKDIVSEKEYLHWLKEGVKRKLNLAYLPLQMYYSDKKEYKNLKTFLTQSYNEDNRLDMGCQLSSYYLNLSQDHNFDKSDKKAFSIASHITNKNPNNNEIYICYDNLAYMYRSGGFVAQDFHKAIEMYKKSFQISKSFVKDEMAEKIAEIYLEDLEDYENAQKWYETVYKLTKDIKYLSIVENYKKSKPIYTVDKKTKQDIIPILKNFAKKEQVATYLESEKYYFISTDSKSIRFYDKFSLEYIKELRSWISDGLLGLFITMDYDEKDELLYTATLNSDKDFSKNYLIKVFDINTGKVIKTIKNKKAMKNTYLALSEDGKYVVAINNFNLLNIINTKTDSAQHYNLNGQGQFLKAKVVKKENDYLVYAVSSDYQLYTFSINQQKRISKEVYRGQISFDKKLINTVNHSSSDVTQLFSLEAFEIQGLKKNRNVIDIKSKNSLLSFDLKQLSLKEKDNTELNKKNKTSLIKVIPKHGNRILELYDENNRLLSEISFLSVSALKYEVIDEKYIIVATSDPTNMLIFSLDGKPVANLRGFNSLQMNWHFQDKKLLTYGADNVVNIFDLKHLDRYAKKEKRYHQETLQGISKIFGGDPLEILSESDEDIVKVLQNRIQQFGFNPTANQIRAYFELFLLEKQEIQPIASLYIKNEKDWILYTPEGLFTYGGEGHKLLKYHQNQGLYKEAKIIENDQLFDKFYRPDLIKKILAGQKVDVPMDVKSVILNIKPPELQILSNQMINEKEIDLVYQVCDAGNGVADTKLIINEQVINPPSSRGFSIEKIEAKDEKCKIYKSTHTLNSGENIISLKAYDKDKNIANQSEPIKVIANYRIEEKQNLYFFSIAVSNYKDDNLDLKYPVNDVKKVKEKLQQKSKSVYESIFTYELHDRDVNLENINKTFDEIKDKININDAFVLYIAGHGVSKDSIYHFIPYDQAEKISIHEIKTNLSKLENNKSLVLLDTCQSGAAIDSMVDEITTVNRLSHDDNRNYIVASSKNQVALEGYKDHGVFTYGVLDAFINNDKLKVWGLADHISEIVPRITQEKFHFSQTPQAKLNQNFILTGEKK
ncbi:MAG: hypothetical protein C0627_03900 [Sulfurimonas sp.]|nr:MAG: hypothetical protein C0627_03900 [Sulfurimonas sp.]